MPDHYSNELPFSVSESNESPVHGYRGEDEIGSVMGIPAGLTIAISREAGSRGTIIAKRAGEKLGWEVYSQELIDFVAMDSLFRQGLMEKLPAKAEEWIEEELQRLHEERLTRNSGIQDLARLLLALGAQGNVVLLGRGAGHILPSRSTLHVRLVAPMKDRIAYMSQWLRLTEEEAEEQVRKRDARRAEFLVNHFHHKPSDVHLYDMVLNTGFLGEERCADLIVAAAKAKMTTVVGSA